jgi:hypothetical protein
MAIYQSIHTGLEIDNAVSSVSGLTTTVNQLNQDVITISGVTTGHTTQINQINIDLGSLNNTVTGHTEQIGDINQALITLNNTVTGHTEQISDINLDIVYLSGATSGNTSQINQLNIDLGSLNNTVTGHTSQLISLNNTLTGHTSNTTVHITGDERNTWNAKQNTNLYYTNITGSTWVADTTYAGYGYKCDLAASGVTASMYPIVTFGATESISGNYLPICESGTNIVTIYSKVNTSIVISLIKVLK